MNKPSLFRRLQRLWALSGSPELQPVIERTVVERTPVQIHVPSATVEDICIQAIARLRIQPGDVLVARFPDSADERYMTRATRVLNQIVEKRGGQLLLTDSTTKLELFSFPKPPPRKRAKPAA